jgi:hypothetical protein
MHQAATVALEHTGSLAVAACADATKQDGPTAAAHATPTISGCNPVCHWYLLVVLSPMCTAPFLLLDTVPVLSNEFRTVDTVLFWFPGIMFMPITLPPDKIFNLVATFESVAEYSFHFVLKFITD